MVFPARFHFKKLFLCFGAVSLTETLHASLGIDIFGLSREERMARGTRVYVHFLHGRTSLYHMPTRAGNRGIHIVGMNIRLHKNLSIIAGKGRKHTMFLLSGKHFSGLLYIAN